MSGLLEEEVNVDDIYETLNEAKDILPNYGAVELIIQFESLNIFHILIFPCKNSQSQAFYDLQINGNACLMNDVRRQ